MLKFLYIKNLAIIDSINIEFNKGLTAITGETGAGKSLIIDAIGLLTGSRSSASLVRTGETKAIIEGTFEDYNPLISKLLNEWEIDETPELVLRRDIYSNGKSTFRVNGLAITLSQAEILCDSLVDIHVQNDTMRLFDSKNYLSFIDDKAIIEKLKEYDVLYHDYLTALKEYKELVNKNNQYNNDIDYLKYQLNELTNAKLKINEEEELRDELKMLNNFEVIYEHLEGVKGIIQDNQVRESLYDVLDRLKKLCKFDPKYCGYLNDIESLYYSLEDLEATVSGEVNHLEFDENRLNEVNERLSEISRLQKKYHKDTKELLAYIVELKSIIDNIDNADIILEDANKKVASKYDSLKVCSLEISEMRKSNTLILKEKILKSLSELMLDKVTIEIPFNNVSFDDCMNSSVFHKDGIDQIDILISFNLGESLKPLSKIASGGEMSRVMLALKSELFINKGLSTVIFDEIDTGMSGAVASGVAAKLKKMSTTMQIFAITHLPIVASVADQQLFVSKETLDNRTSTSIRELDYEERIAALAEMISPNDSTGKAKEVAIEMLKNK